MSKDNQRVLSLGILCFQGFGLRIFEGVIPGAIVLWTFILLLLNWRSVKRMPTKRWGIFVGIIIFYLVFCRIKNVQPALFIFAAWASAFIILSNYWKGQHSFIQDLSHLGRFCMWYSLLHIPIMLFLKSSLITTSFSMQPKTFFYLFYFNNGEGFMGMPRIQGFCWEPSCWNLLLNINLVFTLYFKRPLKDLVLSIISIVSVFATTGLVVMIGVIAAYYLLNISGKKALRTIFLFAIVMAILAPFVYGQLQDKLSTGSGNARMGDFAIAAAIARESPLLGADLDNITTNMTAVRARINAWTTEHGDYEGYMEQGMTNAFASLIVEWGCVLFILIIILLLKTPLFPDKKLRIVFMVALLGVLMGTPISRTGFFYVFVFSTLICYKPSIRESLNIMPKIN